MQLNQLYSASWRSFAAVAAFVTAATLAVAQTTPASSSMTPQDRKKSEETVQLSAFEVTMTEDKGYNHGSSINSLKTDDPIMEIPQSLQVITRDMIDDIGSTGTSDILNYAGVSNFYQGDSAIVRGQRVNMMADGAVDGNFDLAQVDSITIIKGPAAVLYGIQASLAGTILKTTRVPLYHPQTTINLKLDEWGGYRVDLDATGPIKVMGEHKFGYRIDLAHMGGGSFYKNDEVDRISTYGVLEYRNPLTLVRVGGTYLYSEHRPHRVTFVTPEGVPYVGASRDESYMTSDMDTNPTSYAGRIHFEHKLAEGWELQARAAYSYYSYYAGVVLSGGAGSVDFQTNERRLVARRNEATTKNTSADWTINGKYRLFGLNTETLLGMVYYEPTSPINFFPADPTFGIDNVNNGTGFRTAGNNVLIVPMNNPQMHKIRTRQADAYESTLTTSGRGTRSSQTQWTSFVQQKISVIPDRLTLVGSISQFNYFNESENVNSPKPATITATITRQSAQPYGLGLVFKVTKNIAVYATERTTLTVQQSRLFDGEITPPSKGKLQEIGIKTDSQDGRYSATLSAYSNNLTNVAVGTGLISPISGFTYSVLIGETNSKGIDMNLAFRPVPNWQLMISGNQVEVTDQNGNGHLAATNGGGWGVWTRYDFTSDALRKFSIGGGANRFYDRWIEASATRRPDGTLPPGNGSTGSASVLKLHEEIWTTLFMQYRATRNLVLKLHVDNVLDVLVARGFQHSGNIDIGEPRNVKLTAQYRF